MLLVRATGRESARPSWRCGSFSGTCLGVLKLVAVVPRSLRHITKPHAGDGGAKEAAGGAAAAVLSFIWASGSATRRATGWTSTRATRPTPSCAWSPRTHPSRWSCSPWAPASARSTAREWRSPPRRGDQLCAADGSSAAREPEHGACKHTAPRRSACWAHSSAGASSCRHAPGVRGACARLPHACQDNQSCCARPHNAGIVACIRALAAAPASRRTLRAPTARSSTLPSCALPRSRPRGSTCSRAATTRRASCGAWRRATPASAPGAQRQAAGCRLAQTLSTSMPQLAAATAAVIMDAHTCSGRCCIRRLPLHTRARARAARVPATAATASGVRLCTQMGGRAGG